MSIDMFIDPDKDPRTDPPGEGSELATLTGFLDYYRKTLELKCSGLDAEALEELAASIRAHGVVQPVVVAVAGDDRYRLIVGERRWQAAKLAGLQRLPVIVKDTSDQLTLELALVENLQRADLDPMEQAAAYQRLTRDFGLTQQEVARRVGKSRVAITNTLRLLTLPETVQQSLIARRLTEGHARALLALPAVPLQEAALQRVECDGLSVRATEELVRRLLESAPSREQLPLRSPDIEAVEDELRRVLGTKVTLRPTAMVEEVVPSSGDPEPPRTPSFGETLTRVVLLASSNTSEAARRHAALTITPRNPGIGLLEFHQLDRARESGRAAAREALEQAPGVLFDTTS